MLHPVHVVQCAKCGGATIPPNGPMPRAGGEVFHVFEFQLGTVRTVDDDSAVLARRSEQNVRPMLSLLPETDARDGRFRVLQCLDRPQLGGRGGSPLLVQEFVL